MLLVHRYKFFFLYGKDSFYLGSKLTSLPSTGRASSSWINKQCCISVHVATCRWISCCAIYTWSSSTAWRQLSSTLCVNIYINRSTTCVFYDYVLLYTPATYFKIQQIGQLFFIANINSSSYMTITIETQLQSHSNLLFCVHCHVRYGTYCIYFQGDFATVRYWLIQ